MEVGLFTNLVSEAALAPSVHNVQPAMWRLDGQDIVLFRNLCRSLHVGDPTGRDAMVSMGAACEAMCIAMSHRGIRPEVEMLDVASDGDTCPVCSISSSDVSSGDPLHHVMLMRSSHRTSFDLPSTEDREAASDLTSSRLAMLSDAEDVAEVASLCDAASISFMRDRDFRRELVSWFRLSHRHPRWSVDGLNADAMGMGGLEAFGAGLVLGPLFGSLDAAGAVARIVSDAAVTRTSSGIAILHMPAGTEPFEIGRAFMREWLGFEEKGFRAAVLASLVDHGPSRFELSRMAHVPEGRSIEGVWRIGRSSGSRPARARMGLDGLIVTAS